MTTTTAQEGDDIGGAIRGGGLKRNSIEAGEKPASDGLPVLTLSSQTT